MGAKNFYAPLKILHLSNTGENLLNKNARLKIDYFNRALVVKMNGTYMQQAHLYFKGDKKD